MRAKNRFLVIGAVITWLISGVALADKSDPASDEVTRLKQELADAQKKIKELSEALATRADSPDPALEGLDSADTGTASEAVKLWAAKGDKALPRLREIAFKGKNAAARSRAKEAIGQITGQWGSQTDLVWKRSVKEAINPDKPILVLQLFGSLDEEFC